MARSGDMTAEDIGSILEAARAYQRSGMLRAEYSEGNIREEGDLYLLAGRPIYARVGMLVGLEALNRLLGWRNVSYSFASDVPRPAANLATTARWSSVSAPFTQAPPLSRPATDLSPKAAPQRVTAPLPFPIPSAPGTGSAGGRDLVPLQSDSSDMERLVPQKIGPERDPLSLYLTRRQRLIYLLVDGQRTVADIARTTGKTVLEVRLILSELQERSLVAI
jgi:hypothetical protein